VSTVALRTLLLDRSMAPVKVISWQRAITLLTLGKIEVLSSYDDAGELRSATFVIKIPAVVRLLRAFRKTKHKIKFSRVSVCARDGFACQYCGQKKRMGELTYDHVVPRAQGGKTTWTNIVSACAECNLRKGGRTPEQAGMRILRKPAQPDWLPAVAIQVSMKSLPDAWRDYLYWTSSVGDGTTDP